jgi:hypothetical protein
VIFIGIFQVLANEWLVDLHFFAQISWPLGLLVSVVDFEPKKSWVKAPNRPEKKKIKVLPGDQKSEYDFSRIESGINN